MTAYVAPVSEMRFILAAVIGLETLNTLPGYEDTTADVVDAILEEAARLAENVIAPLNRVGDMQGASLVDHGVRTPDGFADAYARYRDGGWNAIPFSVEYGGQGLPWAVATAVQEMWHSANMAFGLCPTLNQGAVEAIEAHGSTQQKDLYLPRLISGVWTGTMNLTEPQAGSDLGAVRCRAERQDDGTYRLFGQKIYITYGEHDLAENIIHLVLARTPDAPAGVKGISLFLVPKLLVDADGSLGPRNDVRCLSLEHKLGIHASPTCVMSFGDREGATGFLIGEENHGLAYMFTMMNNARLAVGLQGVAIAERARQQAVSYAIDRVQGRPIGRTGPLPTGAASHPIASHPDVRRMLLDMRSRTEMARTLTYYTASRIDIARRHPDEDVRRNAQARADLLIPIVKACCTDLGVDVASTGIQVHGGMGYIEETGAAQHLRDARIAPIYEGTNGIQANDLVFRKTVRDDGSAMEAYIHDCRSAAASALALNTPDGQIVGSRLTEGLDTLEAATRWIIDIASTSPASAAGASRLFLDCAGLVAFGHMAALSLVAASDDPERAPEGKVFLSCYFAEQWLSRAPGLLPAIRSTSEWIDNAGDHM